MVELQLDYLFEDVCKLAIKIEKQKKDIRLSTTKTFTKRTFFSKGSFSYAKLETSLRDKNKEKKVKQYKDKVNLTKTNQNDKKCFKCHGYGHF